MKTAAQNLAKSYLLRRSLFVLIGQMILVEVLAGIITYAGITLLSNRWTTTIPYFIGTIFSLKLIAYVTMVLKWYFHFYIISEDAISLTKGLIFKRKKTFDIHSIRSVNVRQGLMGRLFNFGTLIFESPLLDKNPTIRSVQNPIKHAQLIEELRIMHLEDKSITNITPVV